MPRSATVRSASLAPDEAALADHLAGQLAHGSFTELTRHLLTVFGAPVSRRLDELVAAGVDPSERLVLVDATPGASEREIVDFYAPSDWPEDGPLQPPDYATNG
jgi:hypothetical protein